MMVSDPVSDLFTRIRNAAMRKNKILTVPSTPISRGVAQILFDYNVLDDLQESIELALQKNSPNTLYLSLAYGGGRARTPKLKNIQRLSRPGARKYCKSKRIPRATKGPSILILSTSSGIMTGLQAQKQNLGGEALGYFTC
uniref:Small ribosomal subunit protein uS8c n=1 Tax=Karenia mikimotoi TaxID=225107 RepID=A0A0U1WP41_KARMI|nr:ribosomal protein S8 [Karenia mikimotoi]